jgi:large subunit ribosomal protein L4
MVQLALRSALSDRAADGTVIVVDSWSFDKPNAKSAAAALAAVGATGKVLVVVTTAASDVAKSMRNLADVHVVLTTELNAYDVLCSDWVVFSQDSLPATEGGAK